MAARALLLLFTALRCGVCHANPPQQEASDIVWEAIKVFEGDASTVSSDFDCQGMSIGVAQWNVGKSFASVKTIIMSVPQAQQSALMPLHGARFGQALATSQQATMTFVRSLQTIEDPQSCDANKRKARWSSEGKVFVRELAKVLSLPPSVAAQR